MAASIVVRIRLGPLVFFQIDGTNCKEVSEALEGYEELNQKLDALCSDLAERIYPEGMDHFDRKDMEDDHEI
jgi:hypothetical protein